MEEKIEILACKCEDCTHWEIVRTGSFLRALASGEIQTVSTARLVCKTCGFTEDTELVFDHPNTHWKTVDKD
jgi:predicted nucleic-acid-binding Zn-ribbon protein